MSLFNSKIFEVCVLPSVILVNVGVITRRRILFNGHLLLVRCFLITGTTGYH